MCSYVCRAVSDCVIFLNIAYLVLPHCNHVAVPGQRKSQLKSHVVLYSGFLFLKINKRNVKTLMVGF